LQFDRPVFEVRMNAFRRDPSRLLIAKFTNDHNGKIVGWNRAAEELLGFRGKEVLGRSCHDVICGRDIFGNRFCIPSCTLFGVARRKEPVNDFIMDVLTAEGETVRARLSVRSRRTGLTGRLLIEHTITTDE